MAVDDAAGSPPGLRPYATVFLVATVAALVIDAALQLALNTVRVTSYGSGAPWWIVANLVERGRWVAFAALLWWLAPRLALADDRPMVAPARPRTEIWRTVAVAVVAVPLLWIVATWLVSAARFTLLGSWATDGRVFVSPDYYRGLLLDVAPWLLAGAALSAVRRHVE